MTKLLIDGDVIAYRAGFASEKSQYIVTNTDLSLRDSGMDGTEAAKLAKEMGGLVWSRKEVQDVDQALMMANIMIKDIKERYAAENPSVSVFLTGVGNFRNVVATRATYKGNRSGSVPPVHLKAIRNHLVERGAIVSAGEEADDLLGIAQTSAAGGSIICSIDKDLLQVPGRHYNFVTKEEVTISPKQAVLNFYAQVLSGDATDNIPGLTGIGPVKAAKAVADCKSPMECWQKCLDLYTDEFGDVLRGFKYALEAAQLVYVRRTPGEIWHEPSTRSLSIHEAEKTEALTVKKTRSKKRIPERA